MSGEEEGEAMSGRVWGRTALRRGGRVWVMVEGHEGKGFKKYGEGAQETGGYWLACIFRTGVT